jgi:antitoxin component of RelBE/YafQ-DinJ toxin-antitoxin module
MRIVESVEICDRSQYINMFLNQIVYKQAIPFEINKAALKTAKLGGENNNVRRF